MSKEEREEIARIIDENKLLPWTVDRALQMADQIIAARLAREALSQGSPVSIGGEIDGRQTASSTQCADEGPAASLAPRAGVSGELADFLRLTDLLPFRIVQTADYAEIRAANGGGSAFALTVSPSFFEDLNRIVGGAPRLSTPDRGEG